MAAATTNALYVLRLVLGGAAVRRHFSSAVLSSAPLRADSSSTAKVSSPIQGDFLEANEDEYLSASSFLPSRASSDSPHIPWPTIFEHGGTTPPHRPRPCDLLARLVAEHRLDSAKKVYHELTALHTRIEQRKVYLDAAVTSLTPSAQGRAEFLFWLSLYPNRPATNNNPALKAIWHPIVFRILNEHLDDTQFISDFLTLAGKKGLLNVVLPLMLTPLTTTTPPHVSERTLEGAVAAYRAATTSKTSHSSRAQFVAGLTNKQIASWWNRYLRCLALAGWTDSARALLYSPPEGVSWTRITRTLALGQGLERREAAVAAQQARENAEKENPLLGVEKKETASLVSRLRSSTKNKLPSVVELASLQSQLEELGRVTLLARYKRRFLRQSPGKRTMPSVAAMWWWHAEILRLASAGRHEEAVMWFRQHFLWIGLPQSTAGAIPPDSVAPRLIPSIQVLTSIIPSILMLEPDAAAYYSRYLSSLLKLPPSVHPTAYTHLAFIRTIAFTSGTGTAREALSRALAARQNPGLPSWNALLIAHQSRGEVDAALQLLTAMESGTPVNGSTPPPPSPRTYTGLIHVAARSGHAPQASTYLKRFKAFIGGKKISAEEREMLGAATAVMRKGRKRDGAGVSRGDGVQTAVQEGEQEEKLAAVGP